MKCVDGPLRGRDVHPSLGEVWQYCLTPYADWPPPRLFGYYVRSGGEYWWQGQDYTQSPQYDGGTI